MVGAIKDMAFARGGAPPNNGGAAGSDKLRADRDLGDPRRDLSLLDEQKAPPDVGAYIDLAICRLRDHLKP